MTSLRGAAESSGDHATSLAALAAQAVIGNRLRLPEARCEGGACGARYEDAMALGEGDLRTRAIAAGWRESQSGLLTCPACQQRAPWPDEFRRSRRAAHAQPAAYAQPAAQQVPNPQPAGPHPADGRRASQRAVPPPQPGQQPPARPRESPAWPPAGDWAGPAPDGNPAEGSPAFSDWEAWRAG